MPDGCQAHWVRCRDRRVGELLRCPQCWDVLSDPDAVSERVRKMLVSGATLPAETLERLSLDPSDSVRFFAEAALARAGVLPSSR